MGFLGEGGGGWYSALFEMNFTGQLLFIRTFKIQNESSPQNLMDDLYAKVGFYIQYMLQTIITDSLSHPDSHFVLSMYIVPV